MRAWTRQSLCGALRFHREDRKPPKHAGRHPEIWGKIRGAPGTWHEQAMGHFRDIYRGPGKFERVTTPEGLNFIEKRLPDGRGIRLNMDHTFKGSVD